MLAAVQLYPYANISDIIIYSILPINTTVAVPETAVIPFQYPLYKQCDSKWGSDPMVSKTICEVGCLMSSTSMAIAGKGIPIGGKPSNPGQLNAWLRNNNGCVPVGDCSALWKADCGDGVARVLVLTLSASVSASASGVQLRRLQ